MKHTNSLWATGLAAFALLFALPSMASADHGRRCQGHCSRCGDEMFATYALVGYDHCRRPIYSWVPVAHRCSSYHSHGHAVYPSRGYGYSNRGGDCPDNRGSYGYGGRTYYGGRPVCPPSRGGFSISFGF